MIWLVLLLPVGELCAQSLIDATRELDDSPLTVPQSLPNTSEGSCLDVGFCPTEGSEPPLRSILWTQGGVKTYGNRGFWLLRFQT